ncbi:MAG: (Fe-S)-binding protein [Desulfitobacterium hafniense]|nr:(Fe-S)-binding protein [Desulfitobacterium hafniense]
MRTVSKRLEELYYKTDRCVRCGRCIVVCPTYNATMNEAMLSRGRIRLVREYVEGSLKLSERLKLYNNLCLGCGACVERCPSRIDTPELVIQMKEEMNKQEGMALTDSLLLRKVMTSPQSFRRVIRLLSLNRKIGVTKILPEVLKSKEQILPEIPEKSFRDLYYKNEKKQEQTSPRKFRVGYFVGCLTNALYPSLAFDMIKVLEQHDCEVIIPEESVCCGLPHQAYADNTQALQLASKNMQAFLDKKVDYIVTDCGSCGHGLKHYQSLDWNSEEERLRAQEFSSKMLDIHQFLVDVAGLKVGPKPIEDCSVTYHDSCHLSRNLKVKSQPREILRSIPGVEFKEMPEANWCCGAAGSYSFQHTDISQKILKRKMDNVKSSGAQYLTAGCPGCMMQLDHGKREFSLQTEVLHPIQILARTF